MANTLPTLVCKICYSGSAWIVGGAAKEDNPKDWDVAVPFSQWQQVAALIPVTAIPNTFGGWKIVDGSLVIDIWPCDLGELLTNHKMTDLYHPKSGARYTKISL